MMKRFIHKGYFTEIFRQLRVAGIVSSILLMLVNLTTFISLATMKAANAYSSGFNAIPAGATLASPMKIFVYVMGIELTFLAFGWMNKRSSSDFYHAVPVTRTQMYWSTFLAILAWMFIGLTAYAAVHALLYMVFGAPFNYLLFLCVFVNMLIGAVEVSAASAIACAISGTRFVNLCATIVILFAPRFMLTVLSGFVDIVAPDDTLCVNTLSILFDPSYNIFAVPYSSLIASLSSIGLAYVDYANGWAMLYCFAYSCILAVLGSLAFNKRRSEAAGIPTTNKLFQGVIRTAVGLPFLLVLVYIILDYGEIPSILSLVIFILLAFVGYCLYELISTKSIKKTAKAMPLFSICIGIAALYLFLPYLINIAERNINVSEQNIKGYRLADSDREDVIAELLSSYIDNDSYSSVRSKNIEFNDPESIKIIAAAYERSTTRYKEDGNMNPGDRQMSVRINRKHGRDITRNLYFTDAEYTLLDQLRTRNAEYADALYSFPKGRLYCYCGELGAAEMKEVTELFREEYESLSNYDRVDLWRNNGYDFESLSMNVIGCLGADNFFNRYKIGEKTPRTYRRYVELINEKNGEKVKEGLKTIMGWMENGDTDIMFDVLIGAERSIDRWSLDSYYSDRTKPLKDTLPDVYRIVEILYSAQLTADTSNGTLIKVSCYGRGAQSLMENLFSDCSIMLDISESDREFIEETIDSLYNKPDDVIWDYE